LTLLARIGRFLVRHFDSAGNSPRWPRGATMPAAASTLHAARATIAARTSWLVQNAPVGSAVSDLYVTSLIGDGPSTRSGHPNRAMAQALDDAWLRFYEQADIEGAGADLTSILERAVRGLVGQGEAFVRFVTNEDGELRLQMLEPSQIDSVSRDEFGRGIVQGVEFDAFGRRAAYYVREDLRTTSSPVRLPASEVAHIYSPRLPGQVRGLPILSPVATTILELDALQDALLAKARVSALHCAFVRDLDGASGEAFGDQTDLSMEPGSVRVLPSGADVTFPPTSDFAGVDPFLKHMLRQVAAGTGTPYELLASDLSETSYSSAKMGRENWERRCRALRSSVLEYRFLLPCWKRFVALEILSGRINAPDYARDPRPYHAVTFLWPAPAALDPFKEANADVTLLRAGIASRQEIIERRGRDFAEVQAEIDADSFEQPTANVTSLTGEAA